MKTEYITVDFDLKTNGECGHIVKEFERRNKAFQKISDEPKFKTYIILSLLQNESAESCIIEAIKELESYPEEAKKELERIEHKEFHIGYRAGSDQPAFNDRISCETAKKAASLGIDIGICIYPSSDDPEMYLNQN